MSETDKALLEQALKKHLDKAWNLSKKLKEHPELPYHEKLASQEISTILADAGYQVEYPFMSKELGYDTAFKAVLKNGEGPEVAILTEYDALPEVGHGCGHNLHGSLSVLTALALAELKEHFSGTINIIGTPAEEENGAKIAMAEHGVFDNMALAAMIHCWAGGVSQPNMDVLSLRCYVVEFQGVQAHAVAGPWQGRSALAASRKFLDLIDARRECFTPDIKVNSVILNGGLSPNIIPEYAKIRLEFRTDAKGKLEAVDDIIKKCAQGAAIALDCKVSFTPGTADFADMVRVTPLEKEIETLFEQAATPTGPVSCPIGSSDMGNVSYCCPSIQPLLSITKEKYALHTPEFRDATCMPEAYEALEKGASSLSLLSLKILNDEEFRNDVQTAFLKEKSKKL